ncbi:fimbrillin family protein [uncultured Alistipes sp.]|nr:fimbrillin family protein [uncultured Alistipes sp.]
MKMKIHTIIRTVLAATMLLATASCAKDEGGSAPQAQEVVFAAGIAEAEAVPATRMVNDTWQPSDAIGVFMVTPGGTMPDNLVAVGTSSGDNCQYVYDGSKFVSATAADKLYYPHDGSAVDFIAYYPYKPTGPGGIEYYKLTIPFTDQSDPAKIDHLWTKATGISQNKQPVPLQFAHMLCVWELNIVAGDGIDPADLAAMTVTWKGYKHVKHSFDLGRKSSDSKTVADVDIKAYPAVAGSRYEFIVTYDKVFGPTTMEFAVGDEVFVWNVSDRITFQKGKRHPWTITLKKSGLTATPGSITDWEGKDDDPIEGVTGVMYKVGDYYPDPKVQYDPASPGTVLRGTAATGVVFWTDPSDRRHGKIVSLDHGTNLRWDQNNEGTNVGLYDTKATSTTDGLANMAAVKAFISANGKNWSWHFPALAWCDRKNGTQGTTSYASEMKGVWYLPAYDELGNGDANSLYVAYDNYGKAAFNIKLVNAGGTAIASSNHYSSTQGGMNAFYINLKDGTLKYTNPFNALNVRGVMAF